MAKGWLVFAVFFGALAALSFASGEAVLLRGHVGSTRRFAKEEDPRGFGVVAGAYAVFTLGGFFLARYQFRRGSWFNPI